MLFNSFAFLIFLPIVFVTHWLLCRTRKWRNLFLLAASYFFYGWWDPKFLLLIFLTTAGSYASGLLLERFKGNRARCRWVLWSNIAVNIGVLGLFKYFNFFSHSFAQLMRLVGWEVDAVTLDLILPVGVSFYTFQALSYSIDVYRGVIPATRDFIAFSVFIAFFPQLVAGPIERSTNLLPQFLRQRTFDYGRAVEGMKLILWGLFKKMVVADNAARIVDWVFPCYTEVGTLNLWIGAILFSFQIYCDFSGYSDVAIGVSRLFGVELMRNFRFPYFSKGINDFWKRWHISLTSWFRDYIYIPLGGNRRGKVRTATNTFTVFALSGLWHGANYTFIAWGMYHALLMLPHIFMRRAKPGAKRAGRMWPVYFRDTLIMGLTFFLVMIGWILFRADHLREALDYIRRMFISAPGGEILGKQALVYVLVMLAMEWASRDRETPFDFKGDGLMRYRVARWGVYAVVFLFTLIFAGNSQQFIYFQF